MPQRKIRLTALCRRSFSSEHHPETSQFVTDALQRLERHSIHIGGSEIYAQLLHWCGSAKNVTQGRKVHQHLVRHGYGSNTVLGNCLIQMYRRCSRLDEAKSTFDSMPRKDVVSWNALISGYVEYGSNRAALELYLNMDSDHGVQPNRITFVSIVGACGNLEDISQGTAVHARIRSCKLLPDVVLETALLTMYSRCGNVHEARKVFEAITKRNVISWTAMITAYAQCGHQEQAAELYERMDREGIEPNRITFISAVTAYSYLGDLQSGERIHARVVSQKMELDGSLGNALLSMYARCGRIDKAREVFDGLPRRNVVSWTSIMSAYNQNGMPREALELYRRMDLEPNSVTYMAALTACSALGAVEEGAAVHARIVSQGCSPGTALLTSLVTMYGNCGRLDEARRVFDTMEEKNVTSWNSMLGAYAHFAPGNEALGFFRSMELQGVHANPVTLISVLGACASLGDLKLGKEAHRRVVDVNFLPDSVLETALMNMYSKCHRLHEARRVFDCMHQKDVVSWTTIIAAYAQEGWYTEALKLYKRMVADERVEPNLVTYVAVLGACAAPGALDEGREIHRRISRGRFRGDELVLNSLLNMYSKCGSVEEAREVFEGMRQQQRTVVSWNTILTAYVQAGRGGEAIEMYERMQSEDKIEPDETTAVTFLAACSSVGEFGQGRTFYTSPKVEKMRSSKGRNSLVVENAIVNLHGKCGFLEEGRVIFECMEVKNLVTWTAMIVGYAQHGHGRDAFDMYRRMHLDGAEPDSITFITIFIACSHSGLVWDGRECFISMVAEWRIPPNGDHYVCMVDLLGRAGWVEEAEELVETMPFEPEGVAWMTLLGSCRIHHDSDRARRVEGVIMERNPEMLGSHVLLSNIYLQGGLLSSQRDVDYVPTF